MNRLNFYSASCWMIFLALTAVAFADDPLNAFPTSENTAADRVGRLAEVELKEIKLPEDGRLVFSYAEGTLDDQGKHVSSPPLLRVFADGRVDSMNSYLLMRPSADPVERRTDRLSKAELQWLLHLAVNECKILKTTSNEVEQKYQDLTKATGKETNKERTFPIPGDDAPRRFEEFRADIVSGKNELLVPKGALLLRPLRTKMQFGPFASLKKYVYYLAARTYLGDAEERNGLLDQVNAQLAVDHPDLPPFQMEHLNGAVSFKGVSELGNADLVVGFQQELQLAPKKYKQVTATLKQADPGDSPTISFIVREYSRLR